MDKMFYKLVTEHRELINKLKGYANQYVTDFITDIQQRYWLKGI